MKNKILTLLFFFTLTAIYGQYRQLVLKIVEEDRSTPIKGARVMIEGTLDDQISDSEGKVRFNVGNLSKIHYIVKKINYLDEMGSLNMSQIQENNIGYPINLKKIARHFYSISGLVRDCTGKGLSGVVIFYNIGKIKDTVVSEKYGNYEIVIDLDTMGQPHTQMPRHIYIDYKDGCNSTEEVPVGTDGANLLHNITKYCKCNGKKYDVDVKVLDSKKQTGIPNATVRIYAPGNLQPFDTLNLDNSSMFQIKNQYWGGKFIVRTEKPRYWTQYKEFTTDSIDRDYIVNVDKRRLLDFNRLPVSSGMMLAGTFALAAGGASFIWAYDLHRDYSRNEYEADFVKKRPGFSNRQEAYAALERARKRSAWLLPAGAVIVGVGCWIRSKEVKIQERKTERKFNSGQANGILSMRTGFFDFSLTYTF